MGSGGCDNDAYDSDDLMAAMAMVVVMPMGLLVRKMERGCGFQVVVDCSSWNAENEWLGNESRDFMEQPLLTPLSPLWIQRDTLTDQRVKTPALFVPSTSSTRTTTTLVEPRQWGHLEEYRGVLSYISIVFIRRIEY
jgi:hypothetical protein